MFRKILIANDGSENAGCALHVAIDLARRYGAELHLVIGHKGHSKIWRFPMGSTAAKIAEHARTNLLIVQ